MRGLMKINQVAVLGSGMMGGQIAAMFANANIPTLLFDYKKKILADNIKKLSTLTPPAFTQNLQQQWLTPCSYKQDLDKLSVCDLVIEAIIEDFDAKRDLFIKVVKKLPKHAILASNTSSLSITKMQFELDRHQERFCGIHFFNPPRYMPLVELVAGKQTESKVLTDLEVFLTTQLGKNIIHSNDEVGFIANRIGVFSIAACIHHAKRFSLGFDTIDALTGVLLHRPKSATFRTADLVGLDILKHVLKQFYQQHINDPWRAYFLAPSWLDDLVAQQHLGVKTKIGIYYKEKNKIKVYQTQSREYQLADYGVDKKVKKILKQDLKNQLPQLKNCNHSQAQFIYAVLKDTALYSAYHLDSIANSTRDVDWALHWGFGWEIGIFEYWQTLGVANGVALFGEDSKQYLPTWLQNCENFYTQQGAWSPELGQFIPYSGLSVYNTQLCRPTLLNEALKDQGETVFENNSARCWHQGDRVLIFTFKTQLHTLNLEVIQSLDKAINEAQENFQALVIWQAKPPFSAGANLYEVVAGAKLGMIEHQSLLSNVKQKAWSLLKPELPSVAHLLPINALIQQLQNTFSRLKYSSIPVVSAVQGLALGGGCELLLHTDRVVASCESYIGLVEMGVGLLPAGGGCCVMAERSSEQGARFEVLAQYFEQIGTARVSNSAEQARKMGYLRQTDVIIAQPLELLYIAKQQAKLLLKQHYRPSNPNALIKVGGREARANILAQLTNMRAGGYISEYDYFIAEKVADTICGGDVDAGTEVGRAYLLDLERHHFLDLLKQEKTQKRIEHMLTQHKPLRN